MSKPICTVMVGLPALGKSTHIQKLIDEDTWIYSTYMYIESVAEDNGITYSEAFESNIQAATEFNNKKLETMISLCKDIIWDQTNLGVGKRKKIIGKMKNADYIVDCKCILPPEAGWIDDQKAWSYRLKNRPGKTIPQHVLSNMIESFVVPTIDEGFDSIQFYNMHGALLGIDYDK